MKKLLVAVLVLSMGTGLFVGCSTGATSSTPVTSSTAPSSSASSDAASSEAATDSEVSGQGLKIALSSQHLTNDFNRGILAGVQAKAKEMGAELITANAQGDSNQQVSDIENFLTMGVDAVIIGGGEGPAFAPIMQDMAAKGIPCITVDITSEFSTCNLTSDNFNGGEQLALYVTNKLGGKGNILVLDTPGWHSLEIRLRMLDTVIMDYPDLKVAQTISIGTQDAVNNYYKEVKSYLLGNSDIQAIYCSWGLASVGASQAVRELGLQDKIFVVCTDADQVVLEEMKKPDSPLTAVVGQYPEKLGSGAVEMSVAAANKKTVPGEAYAPIILVEKTDPSAWFSAPAIMGVEECWDTLYGGAK